MNAKRTHAGRGGVKLRGVGQGFRQLPRAWEPLRTSRAVPDSSARPPLCRSAARDIQPLREAPAGRDARASGTGNEKKRSAEYP